MPVLRQRDELAAASETQLRTDDEFLEAMLFGRRVRAYDPGHRALVGNCECFVAERNSCLDEFFRMGRTAQERKIT